MAHIINDFPLLDGPLVLGASITKRHRLVSDMALDLVAAESWHTEPGAILSLYGTRRYRTFDIMVLIDDARQAAAQEMVYRVMSEPVVFAPEQGQS